MRYYLRRHSDIDANSFRMMTYHELFDVYQNAIWFDNVFRLYFGKPYFFHYEPKKTLKNFVKTNSFTTFAS